MMLLQVLAPLLLITLSVPIVPPGGSDATPEVAAYDIAAIHSSPAEKTTSITEAFDDPPREARFTATNVRLINIIQYAFDVSGDRVKGVPVSLAQERLDIQAQSSQEQTLMLQHLSMPEASALKREMLQRLLYERFHLRVVHTSETVRTFHLEAGRPHFNGPDPSAPQISFDKDYPTPSIYQVPKGSSGDELIATDCSMPELAKELQLLLDRPVVDHTNLRGTFTFHLQYKDSANLSETDSLNAWPPLDRALGQIGLRIAQGNDLLPSITVTSVTSYTPN